MRRASEKEGDFDTVGISIHALHEESDPTAIAYLSEVRYISIHALHEESDTSALTVPRGCFSFQSTLSMRRATRLSYPLLTHAYFNPRSP